MIPQILLFYETTCKHSRCFLGRHRSLVWIEKKTQENEDHKAQWWQSKRWGWWDRKPNLQKVHVTTFGQFSRHSRSDSSAKNTSKEQQSHLTFLGTTCLSIAMAKCWTIAYFKIYLLLLRNKLELTLSTSGPVMKRYEVSFTMNVKSVSAGEYTAPPAKTRHCLYDVMNHDRECNVMEGNVSSPAQGPMMRLIWGMTPDDITFL